MNLYILFFIFIKLEEASVQSEHVQCKDNVKPLPSQPQLRLHELRVEKYYGLVRLLKPGCRTIVLLVDAQSRLKLLPAFHKAVWPYRYILFISISYFYSLLYAANYMKFYMYEY